MRDFLNRLFHTLFSGDDGCFNLGFMLPLLGVLLLLFAGSFVIPHIPGWVVAIVCLLLALLVAVPYLFRESASTNPFLGFVGELFGFLKNDKEASKKDDINTALKSRRSSRSRRRK